MQITLMLTATLVILVILAFLRTWRATIIPALALPLSIIGTFAGMAAMGFSLDNVSLLALTLALGFVVDDAIVVLENIVRYVEGGMKPFEAAIRGKRDRLHGSVGHHLAGRRVHSDPCSWAASSAGSSLNSP